jgi:hypothetical protein
MGLPPQQNSSTLVKTLDSIIEDEDIDVVFFDTLRRFHHLDEKNDQQAAHFMEWLKFWRDKHQLTIFFAHHERKPSPGAPDLGTDRARGSTEWTAGFDAHLSITKHRKAKRYHVDCAKVRGFSEEELTDLWVEFQSSPTEIVVQLSTNSAISNHPWLMTLWPVGTPVRRSQLISAYMSSANCSATDAAREVDSAIRNLVRQGLAWTTQRGLWLRKK